MAEYYHDTLKISPLKNRHRHKSDSANSKSFQRRTNNGYSGNGEISILTGEDRKTSPRPLIESIISGGGKITSWRQSGKIRSWPRQKLFSRIKGPFIPFLRSLLCTFFISWYLTVKVLNV